MFGAIFGEKEMKKITICPNDAGQRLDRFLRKYMRNASLGYIYKCIRKDVKVNGKRKDSSYMLCDGDEITLYVPDEALAEMIGEAEERQAAVKPLSIVYEDENILIANKPFGLLTHGDSVEKKDHLANRVKDYLIAKGEYDPRSEKVFAPAPANRLDRNTTGLVVFGKNASSLRELNRLIRSGEIGKFYLTIVCGELKEELRLSGGLVKDESANRVTIVSEDRAAKHIETVARPIKALSGVTLVEVELLTGRTHQIRAHLASVGYPVAGDAKYATGRAVRINRYIKDKFGAGTQLLHSTRLVFGECGEPLGYLSGRSFEEGPPKFFTEVVHGLEESAR